MNGPHANSGLEAEHRIDILPGNFHTQDCTPTRQALLVTAGDDVGPFSENLSAEALQ